MDNAMILGYGVVGKATAIAFNIENKYDHNQQNNVDLKDFFKKYKDQDHYYFICVPTPNEDGKQDLTAVMDVIQKVINSGCDNNTVFILRSTVIPGTTSWLEKRYNINIAHFPEFLTEKTAIGDEINPQLKLIGFNNIAVGIKVTHLLGGGDPIWFKPETTELVKYAMNTFFATKVILGNVFSDLARHFNADYQTVRDCLEYHKWGSKNGWNPYYGNKRGFHGKCLPKDVEAMSYFDQSGLLKKLLEINNELSKV